MRENEIARARHDYEILVNTMKDELQSERERGDGLEVDLKKLYLHHCEQHPDCKHCHNLNTEALEKYGRK